ncbi:MAG: alpha/beta hydrolase [Rhizobacter sp.]
MTEHSLLHLGDPLAPADLSTVTNAVGLVVFVHADGGVQTARHTQSVQLRLQARSMSTLDLNLLSAEESTQPERLLDVVLLTDRLTQVVNALPVDLKRLPLVFFGSDAGTAAAMRFAAQRPREVTAIASRSGRPDLAADALGDLRTPTLLIVGAADTELVEINRQAFTRLRCEKRIDLVPRATHRFLEAGTLDVAAQLAGDWFDQHLGTR